MKTTMETIEKATQEFAKARRLLAHAVTETNKQIEAILLKRIKLVRELVCRTAERRSILANMIEESPGCFEKPRTVVFDGVKIGFRKGTGKMDWEDDEHLVKLIEKHFEEQSDVLIKTSKKPIAKAIAALDGADLKKLGITVEDTGDVIVIQPVDSAVDKIVKALLKNAADETEEEA